MLYFLIFLFFYCLEAQNYCRRADGIKITVLNDCFSSSKYNVENCCFECLQINPNNQSSQIKCGSLYSLGFNTCSDPAAKTEALKACGGFGTYACLCNPGSIKTESNESMVYGLNLLLFMLSYFMYFNICK
jgi:hypothetical protein